MRHEKVRLPKVLSRSGYASRRSVEAWIRDGRVTINGRIVWEPGTLVDPDRDLIAVDGRRLRPSPPKIYILLNKPRGVVTTLHDPQGRPTVADLLKGLKARVFPVGRLDCNTEGLVLITNDGELAHQLLHPRYGVERAYLAKVKGHPDRETLERLPGGIELEPGVKVRARVKVRRMLKANAWLEIVIREGRHREVRRLCEAIGHTVLALRRHRFGPLTLGGLPPGRYRHLTDLEVQSLKGAKGRARPVPRKDSPDGMT